MLIGTVDRYPTQADAERAVEHLRIKINSQNPQSQFHSVPFGGLIDRFEREEVPKRCRRLTAKTYRSLFENDPKWGDTFVRNVRTMPVEDWLESMPHSRQLKYHVRNLLRNLFQAVLRWEMVDRNPTDWVRQSRKRLKKPRVLTPAEFKALLAHLAEPQKTMVLTVACLGLRVSELLSLQSADIDFDSLAVSIRRSVVEGEINETKTEASDSTLPLDSDLAEVLLAHKERCPCSDGSAFVFAGRSGKTTMAGHDLGQTPGASSGKGRYRRHRVAYFPARVLAFAPFAWGEAGGAKGTAAPRRHHHHVEHLRSGGFAREARNHLKSWWMSYGEPDLLYHSVLFGGFDFTAKPLGMMVGAPRFELGTSWSRIERATSAGIRRCPPEPHEHWLKSCCMSVSATAAERCG
jgi:hypothetical protein